MQRRAQQQAEERVKLAAAEAARRTAEENTQRSDFLAHASRVLSGSLDAGVGAHELLRLTVPEIARFAALIMLHETSKFERVLSYWSPHAENAPVFAERDFGELPDSVQQAFKRTCELRRRVGLNADDLQDWVADATQLQVGAVVPLVIGERALGALMVAAENSSPDWPALEELASRAAIAFENAYLYSSLQMEIVERRQAENKLTMSNRRKDEFLAMLSHELRNPLAPIRTALEVMRNVAPPHPKLVWAMEVTDRQLKHMTRLVEELLDVARISQGKNVLQNDAAKYTDEGGHIHVGLTVEGGKAVISVRDTGIGIDAELLPNVFELFEQGHRALDRSQGGLGVGLTVVQRLVQLHNGHVEAESKGVGKGSEFRVCLPCLSEGKAPEDTVNSAVQAEPVRRCRVLVVDDNIDAADTIAMFLKLLGHEVKTAADGEQALACAPGYAPDVVVLDIGLPTLNGYEVARRLRAIPETQAALLIALTGYGQESDRLQVLEAGFDKHLVKPANPQALVEAIACWQRTGVDMRRSHRLELS